MTVGKVRVKTLGEAGLEREEKKKEKVKKEQKAKRTAKAPGMKGGERVVAVGPTEEELARLDGAQEQEETKAEGTKEKKERKGVPRTRSSAYKQALVLVDRTKTYRLKDAIELLKKTSFAKFDGTVELHINVLEKGLNGQIAFPHSTGKKTRVAIASDELISDIEKGVVEFDLLLSSPDMMGKLAKVARILGPRGLMPNPKSGTISDNPQRLAASFAKGQVNFRTELQAPIIHLTVGKMSMKEDELSENIKSVITAIGPSKIENMTLKSTMSPGIKVEVA